jgi:hypothetical protein
MSKRQTTFHSAVLLMSSLLLLSGCRICSDCEDPAYPAYGGLWQRTIRETGRVGSTYAPAGGRAFDLAARDQPEGADQLERLRYQGKGGGGRDPGEDDRDETDDTPSDRDQEGNDFRDDLRDRELEDIENPKEEEQQRRELDEIEVRVIRGRPSPPSLD